MKTLTPFLPLRFLRPGSVVWLGLLLLLTAVEAAGWDIWNGPRFFLALTLVGPALVGSAINGLWYSAMATPSSWLLPGAPRLCFRLNAWSLATAAVLWAGLIRRLEPGVALPAALALPAGLMTLSLDFKCVPRAVAQMSRSQPRFLGLVVAVILGFVSFPAELRALILNHGNVAAVLGLALTARNLARARARDARSVSTLLASGPSAGDPGAGGTASEKKWDYPPRSPTLWGWVNAVVSERSNLKSFLLGGLGFTAISLLCTNWRTGYLNSWYRNVFDPGWLTESDFLLIVPMSLAGTYEVLIPGWALTAFRYPCSRAMRAKVTFTLAALSSASCLLALIGGSLLVGWIAAVALGRPASLRGAVEFSLMMAAVAVFLPVAQWGALKYKGRFWAVTAAIAVSSFLSGLLAVQAMHEASLAWGLKVGVVILFVAIALSQYAYYAAVRRYFLTADFVPRRAR